MSGWIYAMTGSYQMAFRNGIARNGLNIAIILMSLMCTRRRGLATAAAA